MVQKQWCVNNQHLSRNPGCPKVLLSQTVLVVILFFTFGHLLKKKKNPVLLKNAPDEVIRIVKFGKFIPWVYILIFCVTEQEAYIKHLCILKYGCSNENYLCSWIPSWNRVSFSLVSPPFLLERKNDTQSMAFQTWVFGRHFHENQGWAHHIKENDWQYLLPIRKFKLSSKN